MAHVFRYPILNQFTRKLCLRDNLLLSSLLIIINCLHSTHPGNFPPQSQLLPLDIVPEIDRQVHNVYNSVIIILDKILDMKHCNLIRHCGSYWRWALDTHKYHKCGYWEESNLSSRSTCLLWSS